MNTGPNDGPWYHTVAAAEHHDSRRSQLFARACNIRGTTDEFGPYSVVARVAPGHYPYAYNIATRDRGELFLYGGYASQGGAYVVKLDPGTLQERWRTVIETPSTQWSYLGAMGVLGDGYVYSVQNNLLAKIDPADGATQLLTLPQLEAPTGTGGVYNGFVVTPDRMIVAKSIERGPCEHDTTGALSCVTENNLPSTLVVVDPATMQVLSSLPTAEPALGRIALERHDDIDYIYVPGTTALVRYRYSAGALTLDETWGPVTYGEGRNAGGVGLLNDFVVVQTNYLPSASPTMVIAANIRDSGQRYTLQPFRGAKLGWVPSKAACDDENSRLYVADTMAGKVAAIALGRRGLSVDWIETGFTKGFISLVGPPGARQLILPQYTLEGDSLVWRDAATGAWRAQSAGLASPSTLSAISPGFKGRFYYPSFSSGELIELTPEARH